MSWSLLLEKKTETGGSVTMRPNFVKSRIEYNIYNE